MSIIPGWDSIAGSHWWSNFYFWLSIVSLISLGVMEVVSHRYSERNDKLSAIEQEATKKAHEFEIAQLHLEAARMAKQAEELRQKNIDMEAAVAPRILEQGLTSAALRAFTGTPFIVVSPQDFEPKRAAGQIRAMLSMSKWKKFTESIGPQHYPFFDGVVVHILGNGKRVGAAADALVGILNTNKITARTGYPIVKMSDDGQPDMQSILERDGIAVIIIEVGPKPLPASMQLKPEDVPADARGNRFWGNIEE